MGPGASMVSLQTLAKSIVRESLRPKADEVVLISTYPHTIELAEQAAIECQKAGADPAIWLDTDAVFYGQFKNYSDESLRRDRKSTRLNSSHLGISYAVFCL